MRSSPAVSYFATALAVVLLSSSTSARIVENQEEHRSLESAATIVQTNPSLTYFAEAIDRAPRSVDEKLEGGYVDQSGFQKSGESSGDTVLAFTTLMPINSAFTAMDLNLRMKIFRPKGDEEWISHLTNLLDYHISEGSVTEGDIRSGAVNTMTMENGELVRVSHNAVKDVTTLYSPYTMDLAPQARILGTLDTDDGGMAYMVDAVLLPLWTTRTITDFLKTPPSEQLTQRTSSYDPGPLGLSTSTFASLLVQADMDKALMNDLDDPEEAVTVFAPSNLAFDSLDPATLELLTSFDGQATLREVLLYHIVPGRVYTSMNMPQGVTDMLTAQGDAILKVKKEDEDILIVGTEVVPSPDHLTVNGVVHVMDQVLLGAM